MGGIFSTLILLNHNRFPVARFWTATLNAMVFTAFPFSSVEAILVSFLAFLFPDLLALHANRFCIPRFETPASPGLGVLPFFFLEIFSMDRDPLIRPCGESLRKG